MSKKDNYKSIVEQVLNQEIKSKDGNKKKEQNDKETPAKGKRGHIYFDYKNCPDYGGNTSGWARHYDSPEEKTK